MPSACRPVRIRASLTPPWATTLRSFSPWAGPLAVLRAVGVNGPVVWIGPEIDAPLVLAVLDFENHWISWMETTSGGGEGTEQVVSQRMTGDPGGLGYLRAEAISAVAGGPASPSVPGAWIALFAEQRGPDRAVSAGLDAQEPLPLKLVRTRILGNRVLALVLFTGAF